MSKIYKYTIHSKYLIDNVSILVISALLLFSFIIFVFSTSFTHGNAYLSINQYVVLQGFTIDATYFLQLFCTLFSIFFGIKLFYSRDNSNYEVFMLGKGKSLKTIIIQKIIISTIILALFVLVINLLYQLSALLFIGTYSLDDTSIKLLIITLLISLQYYYLSSFLIVKTNNIISLVFVFVGYVVVYTNIYELESILDARIILRVMFMFFPSVFVEIENEAYSFVLLNGAIVQIFLVYILNLLLVKGNIKKICE